MSPSQRVAIVTGASRGLGVVIAGALAQRGFDLVVNARDAESLRKTAQSLRSRRLASVEGRHL